MADQLGEEVPPETAQAWDGVRRIREPVAWTLLVITAIWVLVSAWQLIGLPGAGKTTDPEKALRNLLDRDQMFTELLREETKRLELPAIEVDTTMTEDDLAELVTGTFGL